MATKRGTTGDDRLHGTTGNDRLHGEGGDDALFAGSGNDALYGGAGDDTLFGGSGSDSLFGGEGNDVLLGGSGNDHLHGGAGADVFSFLEGHGTDTIHDFEAGTDTIDLSGFNSDITWEALQANMSTVQTQTYNGPWSPPLVTTHVEIDLSDWGGGTIVITGLSAADLAEDMFRLPRTPVTLEGGDGNDTLLGWAGDDTLEGGAGDDTLVGGDGDDTIAGGAGDDLLYGDGLRGDEIDGVTDRDTFVYAPGGGNDTIMDFVDGEDVIDLTAFTGISGLSDLSVQTGSNHVVIDLSGHGGGTITLAHFDPSDLDEEDFIFHGSSGNAEAPVEGM